MDPSSFSETEEETLVQYSAISPLAVTALLLGVASLLALAQPLLLILPIAATATALIALRRIARSDGAIAGNLVAAIGLALAVLFASAVLAKTFTRSQLLHQQARQFTDDWLELVRSGDLQQAHQLHLPLRQRQPPSVSLKKFYAATAAQEDLQNSFLRPLLQEIADEKSRLQFIEVEDYLPDLRSERLQLSYALQDGDEDSTMRKIRIAIEREKMADGGVWRMLSVMPQE